MSRHTIALEVNGRPHDIDVEANALLIDVLREELACTGTKDGCSVGVCGLCSVLVDGELMSACLVLAVSVDGSRIETIEGLAGPDDELTPLQDAFIRCGGFQCGICTPGQIMAATALLADDPHPDSRQVREWMKGNLCRCTGYEGILNAIMTASGQSL